MTGGEPTQKALCFAQMAAAYTEVSGKGRLPAPARMIGYALRRLTGLGDVLEIDYVIKRAGNGPGLLDQYIEAHPEETAKWDVIRDARGHLVEPRGRDVPLGTLEVRRFLHEVDLLGDVDGDLDEGDLTPSISEALTKVGPGDAYGSVLYIEKDGFREILAAAGLALRWDLAVATCKGYSVRAAWEVLRALADRGLTVLVAHDLDKAGIGIGARICDEVPGAIDLGLRWGDVIDPRWGLLGQAERVTYRADPRPNLRERGATPEEIRFLCSEELRDDRGKPFWRGQRIELNAFTGPGLVTWLEAKFEEHGVEKVIPDFEAMARVYRRAARVRAINDVIEAMWDEDEAQIAVPDDLVTRVTEGLGRNRRWSWDQAVRHLVQIEPPIGDDDEDGFYGADEPDDL